MTIMMICRPDQVTEDTKFLSKSSLYLFCLETIDNGGGLPPMDTTIRSEDLKSANWPVLWLKLRAQPKDQAWDWKFSSSGMPLYVSPDGHCLGSPEEVSSRPWGDICIG